MSKIGKMNISIPDKVKVVLAGDNLNIDCNGECFGTSAVDDCGVCDNDLENDNLTCSGCTDSNADNYDTNAIFYDDSCIYSDNIFLVSLYIQ